MSIPTVLHQHAAEAAGIGVWESDPVTKSVTVCPVLAQMLELPAEYQTLTEEDWRHILTADDIARTERAIKRAPDANQPFNVEYRLALPSRGVAWLLVRGTIHNDSSGNPVQMTGIAMDISERKNVEEALRASEQRFRLLTEVSPDGILVLVDDKFVYANHSIIRLLGATDTSQIIGHSPSDFLDLASWKTMRARIARALERGGANPPHIWHVRRVDGTMVYLQGISGKASWNGQPAIQVLVRDLTQKMADEEKLRLMNQRLKLAVEGTGEGFWDFDVVNKTYTISEGLRKILGYSGNGSSVSEINYGELVHRDDRTRREAALRATLEGKVPVYECEFRIRCGDQRWKWAVSRGVVVSRDENGRALAMTGIVSDITARKESEETIWRHANLDALTGLPNRRHFLNAVEVELRNAQRRGNKAALLFVDLDGFKQINDIYGHDAGDQLLVEVAHRIKSCTRSTDMFGRLGGDEFIVLLRDLVEPGHVEYVCQEILASLAQPFNVGNESAQISASMGVALYPVDACSIDDLLRKADQAMYYAKATGKNQFSYFTQEMDDRAHTRLRVSTELRRAIPARQLSLEYQPVIDLSDGSIAKVEALLRWEHPKLGRVAPSVFIPIAEEAGLMGVIGNWVFHEAASCSKRWSERTGAKIQIAVNKSPTQFSRRNLEHDWLQYLNDLGIPASNMVVEITEGLLLDASQQVNDKLLEYRDAGIQVAIDDFGTGYSSMAYLQKFHIDYLKIDQSFVRGIPAHQGNCTIAETIIVMAHKLGLQVIAEGIETQEQHDFLTQAGCNFGQGFFYSYPMAADQVEYLLSTKLQ
jgi:diguanylate cyclase (GGDEF)-like protein/PAS domain S-box-containing protein